MAVTQVLSGVVIATVLLAVSFNPETKGLAHRVPARCPEGDQDKRFFDGVFSEKDPSGSAGIQGYAAFLAKAGEAPLACGTEVAAAYRLTFVSENGGSTIIRTQAIGDTRTVAIVRERGDGRFSQEYDRDLSSSEWHDMISAVENSKFWNRPAFSEPTTINVAVVHGPVWRGTLKKSRRRW